jgi:hypothetical protein
MVVAGTVVAATEYTELTETHGLLCMRRHTAATRAQTFLFWEPPLWRSGTAVQEHLGSFLEESPLHAECSVSFRPLRVFRGRSKPSRAISRARTLA